ERAHDDDVAVREERDGGLLHARLPPQQELAEHRHVLVIPVRDPMVIERPASALRPGRLPQSVQGPAHGDASISAAHEEAASLDLVWSVSASDRRRACAAYTRDVTKLVLDPDKSRVRLHTFAEGLFARLA